MLSINTTRRAAQVAVAATALTVMGTGVALACHTQPAKPVVHKVEHKDVDHKDVDHKDVDHKDVDHKDQDHKPAPKPSCSHKPTPKVTPAPTVAPSPAPAGQGQVLSATTLPTTLPDTGASLDGSAILGLSAMTGAAAAYLKTRKHK